MEASAKRRLAKPQVSEPDFSGEIHPEGGTGLPSDSAQLQEGCGGRKDRATPEK
jgi:hypothetical protein